MDTFALKIVTPDGCAYDGPAEKLFCRTIAGDVGILPHHCDYCTALGMGSAHVFVEGKPRYAACMGGLLNVLNGEVHLIATTWEWAEDIDVERAQASRKRAEDALAAKGLDEREYRLAKARLERALVRTGVPGEK